MKKICISCGDLKFEHVFSKAFPNKCKDCANRKCYYVYKGLVECPNCHVLRSRDDFEKLYRGKPARGRYCQHCAFKGIQKNPSNNESDGRQCTGCFVIKPITEYFSYISNKDNKSYYKGRCKDCERGRCKVQYKDFLYCHDCKIIKPRSNFSPGDRKSKFASMCTVCSKKYSKKLRDNTPAEKKRETWKKYKETHGEYEKQRLKKWMKENKHKFSAISQRYRTKRKQLEDTLTGEEWEETLTHFEKTCAVCDSQDKIQLDHWIPVSWGQIGNVKGNVVPLCKFHNMSKKNRNPNKWVSYAEGIDFDKTINLYEHLADINELPIEEYKEFIDLCYEDRDISKPGRKPFKK